MDTFAAAGLTRPNSLFPRARPVRPWTASVDDERCARGLGVGWTRGRSPSWGTVAELHGSPCAPCRRPAFAVLDSCLLADGRAPGTVAQVRAAAFELIRQGKSAGFALVLVGDVTKDGAIAGPRVLGTRCGLCGCAGPVGI